uniref:Uncharacterized protein n=1 Tax=Chenopodium quinoa TaxID=63459 RepID=A0A803KU95_CHEQI
MAKGMNIQDLDVYGDSMLVIHQLLDEYEVKKDDLKPYHKYASQLLESFDSVKLQHIPRSANKIAHSLENLAATLALGTMESMTVSICNRWVVNSLEDEEKEDACIISVYEINTMDWRQPFIDYLENERLPRDLKHKTEIRWQAPRFIYYKGTLYRRSFLGTWLRCLGNEEDAKTIEEAHSRVCGAHQFGPKLHDRVKRMGYYWPTMVQDCMEFAKKCEVCQFHANFIHTPPEPLHPTMTSWPFKAWGLNIVGPITPKLSTGHAYILAATDYFSKWAETIPLREFKKENVVDFIRNHIIHRYGVPQYIIWTMVLHSSTARSQRSINEIGMSGLVKLCGRIEQPTKLLPKQLLTHWYLTEEENAKLRLAELEALDEKRLEAQQSLECYHARLTCAFNKKMQVRSLQVGDTVLAVRRPIITSRKTGKYSARNGIVLIWSKKLRVGPINSKFLKRYYS